VKKREVQVPTERRERASGDEARLDQSQAGGDPACWAHLVYAECGAASSDPHRDECPEAVTRRSPRGALGAQPDLPGKKR